MISVEMKWEAPMEELPTLPLTTPQGCLPSFQLYGCQELTHWYASDHGDKGLGCVLWFLEWGQVEHANLMIPAFRCWRAIWLTTVTPKAGFQPPLLRFLFQSGTFLLFRLDEHWFIPCDGAWGTFRLFWLEIDEKKGFGD